MDTIWQDLRFAIRGLRKNPGVSIAAAACLALGIGANTTVFSTTQALLLRPLPTIDEPKRVTQLTEVPPDRAQFQDAVSAATYDAWRHQTTSFEAIGAFRWWSANLVGGESPERLPGARVTADFLRALGVHPVRGRTFVEGEDRPGHDKEVVLAYTLWVRNFGADPQIVNRTVRLDGSVYTVIGVAPKDFAYPAGTELYVPMVIPDSVLSDHANRGLNVVGRLKGGVTISKAQAELNAISARLGNDFPATNKGWGARVWPIERYQAQGAEPFILAIVASVTLLLAIACANVANLLLARATGRRKEIALRVALGAGRGRIIRQLITESICLALVGGLMGVLLAHVGLMGVRAMIPGEIQRYIPGWTLLSINPEALLYTAVVALGTGILFGLAPALQLSQSAPGGALREMERGSSGGGLGSRLRRVLVVGEISLALVLLSSAVLVSRSFINMLHMDPGFRVDHALRMELGLPREQYPTDESVRHFYTELLRRVGTLSGVTGVATVNVMPLRTSGSTESFTIPDRPGSRSAEVLTAQHRVVSDSYLSTMGMQMARGRFFTPQDGPNAPQVAIITERMAAKFWPGIDPLGRRIQMTSDSVREIVGILHNIVHEAPPYPTDAEFYVPFAQEPTRNPALVVRTSVEPTAVTAAVLHELTAMDPSLGASDIQTVERMVHNSLSGPRVITWMLVAFAVIALVMAALGLYGVMAFSVAQRTRELGIRITLGAMPGDVVRMVVGQGAILTGTGIVIGLVGAVLLARAISILLYGVTATDPVTYILVPALLMTVALVANWLPARRATRVDPATALRAD